MFKKNVKRVFVLFVAALMVLSFASCGNDSSIEDLSDEEVEEIFEDYLGNEDSAEDTTTASSDGKIDINQIIEEVQFKNYNGYGYVDVDQNGYHLVPSELISTFVDSVNNMLNYEAERKGYHYSFDNIIEFVPAQDYNRLSNGDTVYIVAKVTDEFAAYGVTVDAVKQALNIDFDTTLTYTVSGLPEGGNPVDVFSAIEQHIVYDGANGSIKAKVVLPDNFTFESGGFHFKKDEFSTNGMDVIYNNEKVASFFYDFTSENYNVGDKAKLRATDGNYDTALNEKFISMDSFMIDIYKEVTISDGGNYIASAEQLSANQLEQIKQYMVSSLQNIYTGKSYEFVALYAGILKSSETLGTHDSTFALLGVFKSPYDDIFGEHTVEYTVIPVFDIIIKPDGSLVHDDYVVFDDSTFFTESEVQEYLNVSGQYNCTKIG